MTEEKPKKITCTTLCKGAIAVHPMTWEELKESYDKGEVSIVLIPRKKKKT